MVFALGNRMQNVMGSWIVQMEVMKTAAVSRKLFLLIPVFPPGLPIFHFYSLPHGIPLADVTTDQEIILNIGELSLKLFLHFLS